MRKHRKHLFLSTTIARGRRFKEGEGHDGVAGAGGDSGQGGNNGGENAGAGASGDSNANNAGNGFDPSTFWTGSGQGGDGTPSGESASGSGSDSSTDKPADLQTQLSTQLSSMNFSDSVFTADAVAKMGEGDFTQVHQGLNQMGQQIARQTLGMVVQILRPFADQIMTQTRNEFQQTLSTRDDSSTLVRDFPAASNPQVRPMIQGVFDQALKNTKGNREAAVAQTKEMLKLMAGITAPDLNLSFAPASDQSAGNQPNNINWLDELNVRG